MDDKAIMVNLGDEKAKEISEVIGNKTCNRILSYLSDNEGTVSDISGKLKIPLNTVDYNVKKLLKSGLIEKASHFWSVKGKRMPTYRVSNRKIIISPKRSIGKVFAWAIGLTGLATLTIREFIGRSSPQVFDEVREATFAAAPKMESLATNAGASDVVLGAVSNSGFWASLSPWAWFLIGAWFAILIFFVYTLWSERRNKI